MMDVRSVLFNARSAKGLAKTLLRQFGPLNAADMLGLALSSKPKIMAPRVLARGAGARDILLGKRRDRIRRMSRRP